MCRRSERQWQSGNCKCCYCSSGCWQRPVLTREVQERRSQWRQLSMKHPTNPPCNIQGAARQDYSRRLGWSTVEDYPLQHLVQLLWTHSSTLRVPHSLCLSEAIGLLSKARKPRNTTSESHKPWDHIPSESLPTWFSESWPANQLAKTNYHVDFHRMSFWWFIVLIFAECQWATRNVLAIRFPWDCSRLVCGSNIWEII